MCMHTIFTSYQIQPDENITKITLVYFYTYETHQVHCKITNTYVLEYYVGTHMRMKTQLINIEHY